MISHSKITPCERFEDLRFRAADQLTNSDVEFMFEHIGNCPFGIHTEEALNALDQMTPRELWSKLEGQLSSEETRDPEQQEGRIVVTSNIERVATHSDEVPRRAVLRTFLAAVIAPVAAAAEELGKISGKSDAWISHRVLNEYLHYYAGSPPPQNRKEMLRHLLKPAGATRATNYSIARDHPHLQQAGPEGYLRDRLAFEAFMQLEDRLPQSRLIEGENAEVGSNELLVIAGSPRSNFDARRFLPFQELNTHDDQVVSNTFVPELIPYHFVADTRKISSQSFADGRWLAEPQFSIGRRSDLWTPRDAVDSFGHVKRDFLLLSRLPLSPTGGSVIIIAGGHGTGTEAFRLVFDQRAFSNGDFLRLFKLLEDHRYFQIVFEVHDIVHDEQGSHARRLTVPENCPPIIIDDPTALFKVG
jgi:hypothetical protein